MTDCQYNPNDPEFLASRSLDEDLSESDRRRLSDALQASEDLRCEAEKLRAVDELVKRWGGEEVELDWNAHSELAVAKAMAEQDEETGGKLDDLLQRWGGKRVELDEEAFTQAVMARVRPQKSRPPRRSLLFRLRTPLAAAAALAIAVTAAYWARSLHSPRVLVSFKHEREMVDSSPAPIRLSIVSFSREPIETLAPKPGGPGISFMDIGAGAAPEEWQDEAPPL
jgi:hypothetical protein